MNLTPEEQAMLAGEYGPGVQKAMQILVALGTIYGAERMVPIASAQVAGVSYKNLGQAGLEFLRDWAAQGAQVQVPTTLNPAGMDLTAWRELGFPEDFARQQLAVIEAYRTLGVTPTCSCTPYLVGNTPRFGEHLAWSESSAVSYANSVLGARTNREGGPSALAAAICGRTPAYGLHLNENRRARYLVEVRCPLRNPADWGALGYLVGRQVRNAVPYFRLQIAIRHSPFTIRHSLRALGAAMAASGAVALYHVEGITPEARQGDMLAPDAEVIVVDDLAPAYAALNAPVEQIDLVSIGCPHASLEEIAAIARWLEGKQVRTALWVTTARATREEAVAAGYVERIEAAGGRVVADTCLVVAPARELGFRTLATNSAKMAFYAPAHSGLQTRFGTLEQCLEAAVTGKWPTNQQISKSANQQIGESKKPQPFNLQTFKPSNLLTFQPSNLQLTGRVIVAGRASGVALVSPEPIGFLGGVDPETGVIVEPGHPLQGECIAGRVLVFPTGKGSTVGSYTLYRLKKNGLAPAAIIVAQSEAIVAVGAIIADIPMVDQVDVAQIHTGDQVTVSGEMVIVQLS